MLLCPVFLPYGALFNAAFSQVASQFISFDNFTLHNIYFVFFELSATKLALQNTFMLGIADRDDRHRPGAGDRLSHDARARSPAIARSASSPPRRSRSPASCSASACS